MAFRFNPKERWDFSSDHPSDEFWPAKRTNVVGDLTPGLPVVAWQSGTPAHRGIRAVGEIDGEVEGPIESWDLPTEEEAISDGWVSLAEYRASWLGAWAVPVHWSHVFDHPIAANQAAVCRPVANAPNPFPVEKVEWDEWLESIGQAIGRPLRL